MTVTTAEQWRELLRPWNLVVCLGLFAGLAAAVFAGAAVTWLSASLLFVQLTHLLVAVPVQALHRRKPADAAAGDADQWQRWLPVHMFAIPVMLTIGLLTLAAFRDSVWPVPAVCLMLAAYAYVVLPLSSRGRRAAADDAAVPNPVSGRV